MYDFGTIEPLRRGRVRVRREGAGARWTSTAPSPSEHGTVEHLLVMPVTPFEIMTSKVWANGLVVLGVCALSLAFVIQGLLRVPIEGSVALFLVGTALHLFATSSLGIFLGTIARSMPQFGLLFMITLLPLLMLSGGITPRESMPQFVQDVMLAGPTTHFVMLAQAILYRGAGIEVVWRQFVVLFTIGAVLFAYALPASARRSARWCDAAAGTSAAWIKPTFPPLPRWPGQ